MDAKDKVTNPELPEEKVDEESYGDMFGKWVRDRLRTGKAKMKDVE